MILRPNFSPGIGKCLSSFRRYLWQSHVRSQQLNRKKSYNDKLVEGVEVEGFKVYQVSHAADFNCNLIRLEHLGTGAQFAHIDRNDSNNVFGVAFRTTPFDSTGIPHILEHLTLMGSEKYPCRDPFFKMLNRSLATYLNACTYPDFTIYPLATQNCVDYYNLMSVYLDAVFKPKLGRDYFQMEGWRLEHENVENAESPIIFKGVVFNEMKGVYSENQNIFMESLLNHTLPSHTYGVNSGGNPLDIPKLTYEKLVKFRENHYHPSNCRMYSYGNLDLVDRLKFVNENYLRDYNKCEEYSKRTAVPLEPRWSEARRKHIFGKNDPLAADQEKQSMLAVSYLCEDVRNVQEVFELKILSQLLIDGPNSPFYRSLVEPDIGSGYAPTTGYDCVVRDTVFNVGLQGLKEGDFKRVEQIIYKTFDDCIRNGFEDSRIENVLHGIELGIKHQGSDFGINLMFNLSPLWNHDGDLKYSLNVSESINKFCDSLKADKFYLQKMVEKYFKHNNHRLILTMSPKADYEENLKNKENQLLQQILAQHSEEELKNVYTTGLELRKIQDAKEDISCLPTLKKSDISATCDYPSLHFSNVNAPVQICTVPTNNVTYFSSLLDASEVPSKNKILLPLFSQVVSEMGTKKYDYRAFSMLVQKKTDGLNFGVHVTDDVAVPFKYEEGLSLTSLCLDRNTQDMFDLWSILLNEVTLTDTNRFSTLVRNIAGDLANGVADSGHHYAMLNAASRVNPASHRREQFGGLSYIQTMKEIAGKENLDEVLAQIRALAASLLNKTQIRCALNVSPEQHSQADAALQQFISQIPGSCKGDLSKQTSDTPTSSSSLVHYVLPFAVNYCAKAVQCVPFSHPDFAPLRVLCKLLSTKHLLPLVRERFGAYGSGVKLSVGGTLQFFSYRDPNTTGTMSIFDDSAQYLMTNEFSDQDIDEAILGVFREVDIPLAPSDQGMRLFLTGVSDDLFAAHRLQLLNVDRNSLLDVGTKYLQLPSAKVIIGAENEELKDWCKFYSN